MDSIISSSLSSSNSKYWIQSLALNNKVPSRSSANFDVEIGSFTAFVILSASFYMNEGFTAPLVLIDNNAQGSQFYTSATLSGGCMQHLNTENFIEAKIIAASTKLNFSINNNASFGGYDMSRMFIVICFL